MKIVTSGRGFMDIDAYAGCVAYTELLNLQGEEACAVMTAPCNHSVPSTVRSWDAPVQTVYEKHADDSFIVIDVSEPERLDTIVELPSVEEVIDHHLGFEGFWEDHPAHVEIEFVGAACTLVYERWAQAGKLEEISELSASLLLTGILDNTLKLSADITTDRDRQAYADLMMLTELPLDWPQRYFTECQQAVEADLLRAVHDDVKLLDFPGFSSRVTVGQLAIWDGSKLPAQWREIKSALEQYDAPCMMSIISICEGRNYIFTEDESLRHYLEPIMGITFKKDRVATSKLWLRKEIMRSAIENFQQSDYV